MFQDSRQRRSATCSKAASSKGRKKGLAAEKALDNSPTICDKHVAKPSPNDSELNLCIDVNDRSEKLSEPKSSKTKKKKLTPQPPSVTTATSTPNLDSKTPNSVGGGNLSSLNHGRCKNNLLLK